MKNQRVIWTIAATASALALAAFFARQIVGGPDRGARPPDRDERDRVVAQMLDRLERDHRARFAATRTLVEKAAAYCDSPALASAETWYACGLRELYGDFDLGAAEDDFSRSARMRPEWAWPVNALGIAQFVAGRREEALRSFTRALELAPGWSRPHGDLAILYRRAGEMGEALAHAEKALAIEPEVLVNHFNYGVVLDDLGRHAEARERYERVLAAAPDMAQAAYNLACSYGRQGDAAKALPYLERAIQGDPAFRGDAADDPDFDPIRGTPEFARMLK